MRLIDIEPYEKDGWILQKTEEGHDCTVIKRTPLCCIPTAKGGEAMTAFEVLDAISSSYGGKQIFFQEKNGMIYDRYKAEYITLEEAVYRMARMVGDD